jgi:uncharacterized protein YuzE
VKVDFDAAHDLVYFSFAPGPVAQTIAIDDARRYDLDAAGSLVGVEIHLPPERGDVNLVGIPRAGEVGRWLMREVGRRVRGMYHDAYHGHPVARL